MTTGPGSPRVPSPAPAREREEPLPGHAPKHPSEDANAPEMVERILQSDSYRLAVEDTAFLDGDATRGVRLQLDYAKTELSLRRHGVEHTIVVFGGTRLVEPAAAAGEVGRLREELRAHPENETLRSRLGRAERIQAKSHYYDIARAFGRRVAESGDGPADCRVVVMTGGGPGIMEAANRGAHDAHAKTVGLNIELPQEQFPNPYITPDLSFQFRYFALRKMHFLLRAKALVAFPGGLGTLDELFETLTLIQTRKIDPIPVVLVGESFWRRVFDIDFLCDEGVIDPEDKSLFWFAEDDEEIWQGILSWHEAAGRPLFEACEREPEGMGPTHED